MSAREQLADARRVSDSQTLDERLEASANWMLVSILELAHRSADATLEPTRLADALAATIGVLARAFDDRSCAWMFVGELAVSTWTEPRGTLECDLAVSSPANLHDLEQALVSGGLQTMESNAPARLHLASPSIPRLAIRLSIDGSRLYEEALGRRQPTTLYGVPVHVAAPDDLAIFALVAGQLQDVADVDRLIRFGRVPEDESRLMRWARELRVDQTLVRLLAEARRDEPE
jgi:hypothetical protein